MNHETLINILSENRYSRKYTKVISILSLVHFNDMSLARIHFLKYLSLSLKEMNELIETLRNKKIEMDNQYSELLNSEAMRVFGRPWSFSDYKIAGIGCSEFLEEAKSTLRTNRHNYHSYHATIILLNYVIRYHKGN